MIYITDQGHAYGLNSYISGTLFIRQEELMVVIFAVTSPLGVISNQINEPGRVKESESNNECQLWAYHFAQMEQ